MWRCVRRLSGIKPFSLRALAILPPFERREVTIPPGRDIAPDSDWDGAIVVVEEGEVELVGRRARRCGSGAAACCG